MSDDLPSMEELFLIVAPMVAACLAEESWRQWGIGDQHVQDRERIRSQFRQERRA